MSELPNMDAINQMPDEEVAALNRELKKKLIRNFVIFAGIKIAIHYGLYRWAKSMREAN